MVARKTARLVDQLLAAAWKPSPKTDADQQREFLYQPDGWDRAHRFLALRYAKPEQSAEQEKPEQYQLFDTPKYIYRVFVTDMEDRLDLLVGFYNQRAAAENLIKEANNDAGLAAHPSNRWMMNANWFQIAMLAYNLNCWLQLFHRQQDPSRDHEAHHPGHRAATLFVSGRAHLAPLRASGRKLQRSLPGERCLPAADATFATSEIRAGWICSCTAHPATCIVFHARANQVTQPLAAVIVGFYLPHRHRP